MDGLAFTRLDGDDTTVTAGHLAELRDAVGAQLLCAGDPGYEQARRVWNGMIDRRPAAIVRCRGLADVLASVRFASRHRILVSVRGGGHNVAGYGTCDGGLVIDLSPMRHVRMDPEARTVRVAGGATWAEVDRETQEFGQAVPGGIVSTTGVAGLTLGGGQGWLRRTYGMASGSLRSADVVTADGTVTVASEEDDAELLWAIRGGGGNFGVVTSLEFDTHPVGPTIAFAGPVYPLESASRVLAAVRDFMATAPDEVNCSATWWSIPPVDAFPAELHGRPVVIVGAVYVGDPDEGERILRPLRQIDACLLDMSNHLPYTVLQQIFDPFFPAHELRYYWKSTYLHTLDDEAVRMISAHAGSRPSSMSMVGLWALGGALDRGDPTSTAAGRCDAPYLLEILANWGSPAETEANVSWARSIFSEMQPFSTGRANFNFPGMGDEPGFSRSAVGDHWDRLVRAKRRFDPTNLFRLNQNIPA